MESIQGFYYLHTNGELIFKRFEPESDSPFVKKVWRFDQSERELGYIILIEATVLGANMTRVLELAKLWNMDGEDGAIFCSRMKFHLEPHENEAGKGYIVWHEDDDESRSRGIGSTPLLALISYVKQGDFVNMQGLLH